MSSRKSSANTRKRNHQEREERSEQKKTPKESVALRRSKRRLKQSSKLSPFEYEMFSLRSPVMPKSRRKPSSY